MPPGDWNRNAQLPAERIIEMKDKIHERKEHLRQVGDLPVDSIDPIVAR
jgi:hypothetical protein